MPLFSSFLFRLRPVVVVIIAEQIRFYLFIDLKCAARQSPIIEMCLYENKVNVSRPIKLKPFDLGFFSFRRPLSSCRCSIADVQIKNRNKDSDVIKIKSNDLTTLRLWPIRVVVHR